MLIIITKIIIVSIHTFILFIPKQSKNLRQTEEAKNLLHKFHVA